MNDISYGREAEKWPREYSMLARRIQFLRFNDYPVKLVSGNGQSIIGYISKFNQKENMILASDEAKGSNRIEVKLEFLASLEELPIGENLTARLIAADIFNVQPCDPTRKDFFLSAISVSTRSGYKSTYVRWAHSDWGNNWR